jgi:aconitate decarboxylase
MSVAAAAVDVRSEPATLRIAEWVAGLAYEHVPASVLAHARLCLLDGLGCGLYGAQQPWGRIGATAAVEMAPGGTASLWGNGAAAGPAAVALANGTATHGFEIDDIHVRSMFHPGAVVLPAVIAVAETRRLSGRALLTAMVAGYEVGIRVGICAGIAHGMRGFHTTGTVGCVASAAAVAKLLGLSATATAHAIGIGATQAAGLYCARTGAMTKRFHAGHAAQAGVIAGLYAERGFTGSTDVLENPFGGFMSTLTDDADLAELTSGLGTRWELPLTGFKAYAACASAHTLIDNVGKLAQQGLRAENLVRMRIGVSKVGKKNVGWPYRPAGVVAAQMNGAYAAAVRLLEGDAFVDQYREERLADPRVLALIERIAIDHDPALDEGGAAKRHASWVEADLLDGTRLRSFTEQRRGSSHHPLGADEIVAKFERTAGASLAPTAVALVRAMVEQIDDCADLRELGVLLRGTRT